jgi:hypothetical protein
LIALTDQQLLIVMQAARTLRVEDCDKFLKLVADQLQPRGVDVSDAVRRAMIFVQQHNGEQNNAA